MTATNGHGPAETREPGAWARDRRGALRAFLPVLALLAMLATGCEEDVTAVLGTERPFTLFGVLTPQADTQWVRVFPIETVLTPAAPVPLDADFRSLDLVAGSEQAWRDSLIREENGQYAHVFWSPFTAPFGHRFRLEVTRSDGAVTEVEATVPPFAEMMLPPQTQTPPALFSVIVPPQVPNLIRIEVTYTFRFRSNAEIRRETASFSYDGRQRLTTEGWLLEINVSRDVRIIREELKRRFPLDPRTPLKIVSLKIRMIAANAEWNPPGGVFDAEVLVQPGVMSNVQNGFGFVGAGYRMEETWVPLDTIIAN